MTTITIKKTVLILLFSLLVFSQDHNFTLVKIDLADQAKLNYVESLNLPIYLQSENDLITLVNDDKRNKLKAFDVRFVELDKTDSDNSYSLVVWKKILQKIIDECCLRNHRTLYCKRCTAIIPGNKRN